VTKLKIAGLGGSLGTRSQSRAALVTALAGAAEAGAHTQLLDLRELGLPMYDPDGEAATESTLRMVDALHEADGILWSSPLYNGSISGAFKNALDWLRLLGDRDPAYLSDKVIGLISAAGGAQGLQAINTMEFCVRALRGWAVPLVVPVAGAGRAFDEEGRPQDEAIERQLKMLGVEVVRVADHFRVEESPDHAAECEKAMARVAAAARDAGASPSPA
jgi:FMN reductase